MRHTTPFSGPQIRGEIRKREKERILLSDGLNSVYIAELKAAVHNGCLVLRTIRITDVINMSLKIHLVLPNKLKKNISAMNLALFISSHHCRYKHNNSGAEEHYN